MISGGDRWNTRLVAIRRRGVQARDLVFVLVCHHAIQPLGRRARQPARFAEHLRLARHHLVHQRAIAVAPARVLIRHQRRRHAPRSARPASAGGASNVCTRISSSSAGLLGQDAPPQERPPVQRHRRAVQLDRTQDRGLADRDQTALPRQSQQHRVHRLRVAEQVLGQAAPRADTPMPPRRWRARSCAGAAPRRSAGWRRA